MKIYIVTGSCGEQEDYREWNVCSFNSKDKAKLMVKRCQRWAGKKYDPYVVLANKEKNPYDPHMLCDYTGTKYSYVTIDLLDVVPKLD